MTAQPKNALIDEARIDQGTRVATEASATADLESLRLPANYGATLGIKKLLIRVSVDKPRASKFFRIRDGQEWCFPAVIMKDEQDYYIVAREVYEAFDGSMFKPVVLHYAIDRAGQPFLVPVVLPGEDGRRNPWHESLAQAVEIAKARWVRIAANMANGGYDVFEAQGALSEPEWPVWSVNELMDVAFRGKRITSLEHPVIQALQGRV